MPGLDEVRQEICTPVEIIVSKIRWGQHILNMPHYTLDIPVTKESMAILCNKRQ